MKVWVVVEAALVVHLYRLFLLCYQMLVVMLSDSVLSHLTTITQRWHMWVNQEMRIKNDNSVECSLSAATNLLLATSFTLTCQASLYGVIHTTQEVTLPNLVCVVSAYLCVMPQSACISVCLYSDCVIKPHQSSSQQSPPASYKETSTILVIYASNPGFSIVVCFNSLKTMITPY